MFQDVYSSQNTIRIIKSGQIRLAGILHTGFWLKTLKGKSLLWAWVTDERILQGILKKWHEKVWTVFVWFRTGTCHGLFHQMEIISWPTAFYLFSVSAAWSYFVTLLSNPSVYHLWFHIRTHDLYDNCAYSTVTVTQLKYGSLMSRTEVVHKLVTLPWVLSWDVLHYELNVIHQYQQ